MNTTTKLSKDIETLIDKSEYHLAADLLAEKLNFQLLVEFLKHGKHFDDDKESRDIYKCTLSRGTRKYTFNFGQSINASGEWDGHKHLCMNRYGKTKFTNSEALSSSKMNERTSGDIWKNKNFSKPRMYDILACLQKYDVGTFEDFCGEFGYNTDSRKAEKIYNAVCEEYKQIAMLFNDEEIELLQMIN